MNAMLLNYKKVGKLSESLYFSLRSTNAITPRIYGLVKIHKPDMPLRPIVSIVGSATYN